MTMKKNLLIIIFLISFKSINAQDKIVKLSGEAISCKVSEITDKNIKFKYDGEDLINNISINIVKEIVFNSGRTQKFHEIIIVTGESDWEKVQITKLESDIEGLTRVCDVSGKASSGIPTNLAKIQEKALISMKKEAAKNLCHIVLIRTENSTPGGWGPSGGGTKASYIGVGYKY
jgi:hypothetical protein